MSGTLRRTARRTARSTLGVAAFAAAVRLAVLAVTLLAAPATVDDVAALHDGAEYLLQAEALGEPTAWAALPPAAHRLSPGYPLLVRAASTLLPPPLAALVLAVLGAAVAAAVLHRLGVSAWAAALFAVLTPSWVAFSSTAMSEGPFLALALLAALAGRRGRPLVAALLFGAATLVRPVGAVLFVALWWVDLWQLRGEVGSASRRRPAASLAAFALPLLTWWGWQAGAGTGGPSSFETYVRLDLAPPLASLAAGFGGAFADPAKALQNLFVLALTAAAGVVLFRRWRGAAGVDERRDAGRWLVWLGAQAGFYLLLPSTWVWECLGRFLITGLPAVAVAADLAVAPGSRRARTLLLAGFTALAVAVSVWWNLRALGWS